MIKYLLVLLLAGCATLPSNDIPAQVVEWSQSNVWKVIRNQATGSGFWINASTMLTNCHVVRGSGKVIAQDSTRTRNIKMTVTSCDEKIDLALLEYKEPEPIDFKPLETIISGDVPRQGIGLYGAGYPLGDPLLITTGHWQQKVDEGYSTTVKMTLGDSGSPVILLDGNKIVVVGIRTSITSIRQGPFVHFVAHLITVRGGEKILKFLGENT